MIAKWWIGSSKFLSLYRNQKKKAEIVKNQLFQNSRKELEAYGNQANAGSIEEAISEWLGKLCGLAYPIPALQWS